MTSDCKKPTAGFWVTRALVAVLVLACGLQSANNAVGQVSTAYDGTEVVQNEVGGADVRTRPDVQREGVDLYGDRLPAGAILRLGTVRFRQGAEDRISLSYSSDGKILATTDGDSIVLWNAATGERLRRLQSKNANNKGFLSKFEEVAIAPRIEELAARANDGRVVVWDLKDGEETLLAGKDVPQRPQVGDQHRGLAYSPSGTELAVNWAEKTTVYDRTSKQIVQTLGAEGDPAQFGLSWSPKGTYIARGSRSSPARLWNISDGEGYVTRDFKADVEAFALSLAISHDGMTLAAGCIQNARAEIMV